MITSYNPATGNPVWQTEAANEQRVLEAITNAQKAYRSWKMQPFEARAAVCLRYATALTSKKEYLARTISEEMGKPLWESLTEVQAMINKVDISIKAYKERCSEVVHETANAIIATRFLPHGVVAVFGPFNFPGHLPNGHIVPALLAGNTVLFKPSEKTPKVGHIIAELWQEADLPEHVFTLLQGAKDTAEAILSHKELAGVFFTGSSHVGRAIQKQSLMFPGRMLALEMGGNNPLVITSYSDLQACIYLIIQSAFITSGQRCSCARRLILTNDALLDPLVEVTKKIKVGTYTDTPEPFMGPVVSKEAADELVRGYNKLLEKGGNPLVALQHNESCLITPAIVDMTNCPRDDTELFGPILQVIRVKNFDEAINEANNTSFGLAAGLVSDSRQEYEQFYNNVRSGIINWNTPTTGASSLAPFGGIGCSGNFRPSGYFASDYTSYPVASQEATKLKLPSTLAPGITL